MKPIKFYPRNSKANPRVLPDILLVFDPKKRQEGQKPERKSSFIFI
jgi:hypothetical protein